MSKKNEEIKLPDGRTIWNSRSMAVVAIVIFTNLNTGEVSVIANKRGKGTPDFQGKWNIPCGYLDWDETTKEAASRELFEETGIKIYPNDWELLSINDDPKESHQNVTFRYITYCMGTDISRLGRFKQTGGELNEVEEIKLINLDNIEDYDWAFNHYNLLKTIKTSL